MSDNHIIWQCPICRTNDFYPMCSSCGHSFCNSCIKKFQICPLCNKHVGEYKPNYDLGILLGLEFKVALNYGTMQSSVPNPQQRVVRMQVRDPEQTPAQRRRSRKKFILMITFFIIINICVLGILNWGLIKNWYEPESQHYLITTNCNVTNCTNVISKNNTLINFIYSYEFVHKNYSKVDKTINDNYCDITKTITCFYDNADINTLTLDSASMDFPNMIEIGMEISLINLACVLVSGVIVGFLLNVLFYLCYR